MTLGNRIDSNGARPVRIHQAGAAPGSAPQRSPPSATGGPFISSCGARGRERNKKLHVVPSPMCSCGEAEQDTAHILRDCRNHQVLREEVWPMPESLHNKLYGPVAALQRTTNYISRPGLQV
ncbi:hypothetical protein V1264_003079 [Littorina saxatilis]|uniref:Reverse transcriptase n=1 Tax=Littorina saxatilis TaxID=31220 RepID=A0AAN9B4N0_9CAEN